MDQGRSPEHDESAPNAKYPGNGILGVEVSRTNPGLEICPVLGGGLILCRDIFRIGQEGCTPDANIDCELPQIQSSS